MLGTSNNTLDGAFCIFIVQTLKQRRYFRTRPTDDFDLTPNVFLSDYKMLSYRRETALQGALSFWPKVEDWNWKTILYGLHRSIFNHCDIIGLKICQIQWKNAK